MRRDVGTTAFARTFVLAGALLSAACSRDRSPARASNADAEADANPASTDGQTTVTGVTPAPEGAPYPTLAEWHLFTEPVKQIPSPRVVPYDVISPLFADYAAKYRFIYVPEGKKITYSATAKWSFPAGTILVKTFSYLADARDPASGERLLETRLLIHESAGWTPHTYVWDDAQSTATLKVGGDTIQSHFIDASGRTLDNAYIVPSENDCRTCHGRLGQTDTLGGRTRQLDRDHDYGSGAENQIDHLAALGMLDGAPEVGSSRVHLVDPFGTAPLTDRVRAYFDGNCSHCHQPGEYAASSTGFWLDYDSTDPSEPTAHWGVCKQPTAAGGATCGRQFDVVPGAPDDSILICRLESTLAKVRMPTVGRNLVHAEGVELVRQWITAMPGSCGGAPSSDAGADAQLADADADATPITDAGSTPVSDGTPPRGG